MALARDADHFTPRPRVAALRRAGRCLPLWYAPADDCVFATGVSESWYSQVTADFDLPATLWQPDADAGAMSGAPWGWSRAVRSEFRHLGLVDLPSDKRLEHWRDLSHRRTAMLLGRYLDASLDFDIHFDTTEVTSEGALLEAIAARGAAVAKSPWSSSGKGVFPLGDSRAVDVALPGLRGVIARQGSMMVESMWDRALDCAMLFTLGAGKPTFDGLSVFTTNPNGTYAGNVLGPREHLRDMITSRMTCPAQLDAVIAATTDFLAALDTDGYRGPVGVDMMVCADGLLAPAIEINLRDTMGHVALALSRHHLAPGLTGLLEIRPRAIGEPSPSYTARDRRLTAGTLPLTPPEGGLLFTATVTGNRACLPD